MFQETGGYGERLEVTADDGNGTVSIYVPRTKISVRYNAAFSPQTVAFTDPIGMSYVIDRSDLSLTVTRLGGNPQPGRCRIAVPPKRAF